MARTYRADPHPCDGSAFSDPGVEPAIHGYRNVALPVASRHPLWSHPQETYPGLLRMDVDKVSRSVVPAVFGNLGQCVSIESYNLSYGRVIAF
jgi:hypothetical protein